MKKRYVLGVDPAFRTGCKLAAIDPTGKVLEINKVFITLPKNDYSKDEKVLLSMIQKHNIEIIAIGNGTASRETESFIASFIKKHHLSLQYVIISEAGASVYSASSIAKEEFPDYAVEERSAVSIARRLQDPLAELVKIEPKAIQLISPFLSKEPNLVLIEARKNANSRLKFYDNLIVYEKPGIYTEAINQIYSSFALQDV